MEFENPIGKIKKVPLREIWKKEDKEFTKWLEENIDYLNDVLDKNFNVVKREEKVGPFKLDLFAEDENDNKVIIENQLEKTDHDHLGKILTYMINLEANTAIWITKEPRDEHVQVIEWLNKYTPGDVLFYLVKLEAIKIGDQPIAAPLFTIVTGPTIEAKQLGEERIESAQRYKLRKDFWTKLLTKSKDKTNLFSNVSPSKYSWIATGAGKSGIAYIYEVTYKNGRVEIYLDKGKEDEDVLINKKRFDRLFKHKGEIEKEFGEKLLWEKLDDRKASRISYTFDEIGLKDEDRWDDIQDKMIDAMISLEKATKKYIGKLD